jgi:asparaginyl-tRNA synthetase
MLCGVQPLFPLNPAAKGLPVPHHGVQRRLRQQAARFLAAAMLAFAHAAAPLLLRPGARRVVPLRRARPRCTATPASSPPPPSPAPPAAVAANASSSPPPSPSPPPPPPPLPHAPVRVRVRAVRDASPEIMGSTVTVNGWVRSVRDQKAFAFVDVNDGSSLAGLQVVVGAESEAFAVVPELTTGCSVSAVGTIVASVGQGQRYEMRASGLRILGVADASYPLQKKRHSLEFLRTIAHLRPRTNSIGAMSRVRSALATATHAFFDANGFLYLNSPVITASDCEGAGEMFRVTTTIPPDGRTAGIPTGDGDAEGSVDFSSDFFGRPAFLTVSGQLSAETYACALSDVYTFGPTFRAENSNTSRHLAEFWMIEPEMAFATLEDDMANAEAYVKYVVTSAMDRCLEDLTFFDKFVEKGLLDKLRNVVAEPFGRVSYTDAVELLVEANKPSKKGKRRFEFPVEWGVDLQSEHERYLAEEHFRKPVFVYNYPAGIKAFYMRGNDEDGGKTCQAMDLLVPGIGELIGGSAREERLDVLEAKIEALGLDKADYDWYLDLRRYGSVPHAGYGLGFERLVQFVTGIVNIRDAIPYPRYPGSAEF